MRGSGGIPTYPQLAAYFAHLSLECVLKAKIMWNDKSSTLDELQSKWPEDDFRSVFHGKSGHDLETLGRFASLDRALEHVQQRQILQAPAWRRMLATERPYSLRYGTEPVHPQQACGELALADRIANALAEELNT